RNRVVLAGAGRVAGVCGARVAIIGTGRARSTGERAVEAAAFRAADDAGSALPGNTVSRIGVALLARIEQAVAAEQRAHRRGTCAPLPRADLAARRAAVAVGGVAVVACLISVDGAVTAEQRADRRRAAALVARLDLAGRRAAVAVGGVA